MKHIKDIVHVFYINLEHRVDRKIHIEQQLAGLHLKGTRFDAIKHEKPHIGCSLSHIECLSIALKNKYDHVLICEDDMLVLDPAKFINQFNKFLSTHSDWDVILLGGNNVGPYKSIDETSVRVNRCFTTTAYLVRGSYIKSLLDNFKESIKIQHPIDFHWRLLQQKDNWYLIIPLSVIQKEGYSDIQQKDVNYTNEMLHLKHGLEKK